MTIRISAAIGRVIVFMRGPGAGKGSIVTVISNIYKKQSERAGNLNNRLVRNAGADYFREPGEIL